MVVHTKKIHIGIKPNDSDSDSETKRNEKEEEKDEDESSKSAEEKGGDDDDTEFSTAPMEQYEKAILKFVRHREENSHDIIDRLSYQYTPVALLVSAALVMGGAYFGEPIQCWFPPQFTEDWESYAHSYCYVKSTYFLPMKDAIPQHYPDRKLQEISYYQWVPIFLVIQATLFCLPSLFWRSFSVQSGVCVKGVLNSAKKIRKDITHSLRATQCELAAVHIQEALDMQFDLKPAGRFCGWLFYGPHYGHYITGTYIFMKFLYILNVLVQFLIVNVCLGPKTENFWGWQILTDVMHGKEWEESPYFPRVTMCDFQVRVLGNIHRHTVQCVLPINMFNEKIYIFFCKQIFQGSCWKNSTFPKVLRIFLFMWWLFLLAILTTLNLCYWVATQVFPEPRRAFISKYLRVHRLLHRKPKGRDLRLIDRFLGENLRSDGVLLIRLIRASGGELLAGDIIKALWIQFRQRKEKEAKRTQ